MVKGKLGVVKEPCKELWTTALPPTWGTVLPQGGEAKNQHRGIFAAGPVGRSSSKRCSVTSLNPPSATELAVRPCRAGRQRLEGLLSVGKGIWLWHESVD